MSNLDTMRAGYERYSKRDLDGVVDDLFTEDIDWKIEGLIEVTGRAAVLEFFSGLAEQFAGHTITIDDAIENGDRLVCFVTHTVTRHDGETAQFKAVHDWRFRGGQAASLHEIADTLAFAVFAGQVPAPAAA